MADDKREGIETADELWDRIKERLEALSKEWKMQPLGFDEVFGNAVFWAAVLRNGYPEAAHALDLVADKLTVVTTRGKHTWN